MDMFFILIEVCKNWLNKAGYTEIKERSIFKGQLKQGGKYYFTRNDSSIVAFAIGSKYESGNGFIAIGAHSDSPCLEIKPNSNYFSRISTNWVTNLWWRTLEYMV